MHIHIHLVLCCNRNLDTSKEEKFVKELILQEKPEKRWLSRKTINSSLAKAFPKTMSTPYARSILFQNGKARKLFCNARGPLGQTVALTEQDAQKSIESMNKAIREELEWHGDNASDDEGGNLDNVSDDEGGNFDNVSDDEGGDIIVTDGREIIVEDSSQHSLDLVTSVVESVLFDDEETNEVGARHRSSSAAKINAAPGDDAADTKSNIVTGGVGAGAKFRPIPGNGEGMTGGHAPAATDNTATVMDVGVDGRLAAAIKADDESSEWDGESIASADIDAQLQSRLGSLTDHDDS